MTIDPGAGYRLLNRGETLLETDETLFPSGKWEPTQDAGLTLNCACCHYRRKVESADGWIKLSERLPDAYPVEVFSAETGWRGIAHQAYGSSLAAALAYAKEKQA